MAYDVKEIYELAHRVMRKHGKVASDSECSWLIYDDEKISIHYGDGYHDVSFRIYEKNMNECICVLETHLTSNQNIASKEELVKDMTRHGFCDENCPGFTRKIHKRAYEIYSRRKGKEGNASDDWLKAESEILEELELKFPGDWEVATILPQDPHPIYGKTWGPYPCVILKRGVWIEHLESLVSTL